MSGDDDLVSDDDLVPDERGSGWSRGQRLPIAAPWAIGAASSFAAWGILGDVRSALAWGGAAGAVAAGVDPRLFLGLAMFFLLLPPIALLLGSDVLAERLARTALGLLALGVALELRPDGRRHRDDGEPSSSSSSSPPDEAR